MTRTAHLLILTGVLMLGPSLAGQIGDQEHHDYLIGPHDVLTVTVWNEPTLSGKFTVEADGHFTFPLAGRMRAAGITMNDLERELRRRLADGFLNRPQVSVAVDQFRSQRVFVMGEVRQPNAYTLSGDMTLIEALARAGSLTPNAGGEALIVRPRSGAAARPMMPTQQTAAEIIRVDLKDLERGELDRNIRLRDGDTVFVPRVEFLYVSGQVKSPGAYPAPKGITVQQALAVAGGLTDRGSNSRIRLVRVTDGQRKEIKVRLTDQVQPGDTVVVLERIF